MEDDIVTTFISDPYSVSYLNQQILESVLSCEKQESIGTMDGFDELPTTASHDSISVEIEPGKNPEYQSRSVRVLEATTLRCSLEKQRSLCLGLLKYERNSC